MDTQTKNHLPRATPRRLFLRMAGAGMGAMTLGMIGCGGGGDADTTVLTTRTGACGTRYWPLAVDTTNMVSTNAVMVSNTETELTITCDVAFVGATLGKLQLWVGRQLSDVPHEADGFPIPLDFPYQHDATGTSAYTFTVALSDLGFTTCAPVELFIVLHAEVKTLGSSDYVSTYAGWDWGNLGPRWWFYGRFTLCCELVDPPTEYRDETAYAKGAYTFIGMGIGRNWGWAIELNAPGTTTYDILAGAGGNVGGTNVGTLTVIWDGSVATVTWALTGGALMSSAHLYAGDQSPTTASPGRYGNTYSFDPWVDSATRTVALTDSADSNGAWLIAHADVHIPV